MGAGAPLLAALVLGVVLGVASLAWAQLPFGGPAARRPAPRVTAIEVAGNERVDEQAIRIHIQSSEGERLDMSRVDADLRAIYGMGFFDDVQVELEDEPGRNVLRYRVAERPLIASVTVEGNDELKDEDLDAALAVRPRTIYEPQRVRVGIEAARTLYEEKGYLDVEITPVVTEIEGKNQVDLTYKVDQGDAIRVSEIVFEGNETFSDRELKGVMQTKEAWFLSWLFGSGTLNRENLKTDVERVTAFYYDHGHVNVKIDKPVVERLEESLKITLKVEEGEVFTFGDVDFAGDWEDPDIEQSRLFDRVQVKEGDTFKASLLREDVDALTDYYGDFGYAFANVEPETLIRSDDRLVDVRFRVSKGKPVTIGRIDITGNTKTRDKVVRREMRVAEQQLFSATRLRRSRDALRRLGFFSEVNVTTRRADADDKINVLVDLKEGSTGAFSAGAGFSSGDRFLFNVRITENNLFGNGIRVVLNADVGSIRRNIFLSLTDPYFWDTFVFASGTLFNAQLDFGDFTRESTGFSLRLLYPLEELGFPRWGPFSFEDTRVGFEYRLEQAKISQIAFDSPPSIFKERGSNLISSVSPNLLRNTLNHAFDPTAGSFQDISLEFAGLGGDTRFILFEARGRWFFPLYRIPGFGPLVYSTGGSLAWGIGEEGLSGKEIPLVQRFFPGGISTIRGFQVRSLGPREDTPDGQGRIINNEPIGGTNQLVFQNEIIFPIVQQLGLRGVVFFDTGNAFRQPDGIDFGNLRYAAGAGVRWLSPFGPLRIEFGVPLNIKDNENKSSILFSFGAPL